MKDSYIVDNFRKESPHYEVNMEKHKNRCFNIFKKIQNGDRVYVSVDDVSKNKSEETNITQQEIFLKREDREYFRLSILTDEIIEYDLEMFQIQDKIELINRYRPYFISFIISLEKNKFKNIESLSDRWHIGQFISSDKFTDSEGILLNGILEISASPVNYLEKTLLIFTDRSIKSTEWDKIDKTYDIHNFVDTNNSDIEKILNDAWEKDIPNKIDIYNVGHGNADYIRGSKHRILYDIGYNYRSFPSRHHSKYLRAVNAIRHLKPSCVILSHWDMDHIIGCAYAEQDIFNKKWIAPSLTSSRDTKVSINSIRLAYYLKKLDNIYFVNREQENELIATISCARGVEMKIWLGKGTSILTPRNVEGLMIEIIGNSKEYPNILLAGDVPYRCMSEKFKYPFDFIHVPHHCSKMELERLKYISSNGTCAVISTNRKRNGDLNYDDDHYKELKKYFIEVINTIDNPSKDDEANLSVQINYRYKMYYFR